MHGMHACPKRHKNQKQLPILLISVPQYPIWNGYPKRLKRHKNEKQTIQGYFEHKPLDRFPMMKGKDTND